MPRYKDITGQAFGRWAVVRYDGNDPRGTAKWLCRCECGVESSVLGNTLRMGLSKSCGCLHSKLLVARLTTHGLTVGGAKTAEYSTWDHMLQRCGNSKHRAYSNYGGRGVTVCERWRQSFDDFLEDMGRCPPGFSIDRVDVDGNYEQVNCVWASASTQARNQRGKLKRYMPRGVTETRRGTFQARIWEVGRRKYVGIFDTPEEASAAYQCEHTKLLKQLRESDAAIVKAYQPSIQKTETEVTQ